MTATRLIRILCASTFVVAIPGMIVSSIAGNNEGWVVTFGGLAAIGAVVLIVVSASAGGRRIDVFDESLAERIETRIGRLASAGAAENELRDLVRDSLELGRGSGIDRTGRR